MICQLVELRVLNVAERWMRFCKAVEEKYRRVWINLFLDALVESYCHEVAHNKAIEFLRADRCIDEGAS